MIRGANISLNTPIEIFRQVLGGTWDERIENGWHVVVTPIFTVMEKVCDGVEILPLKMVRQGYADLVRQGEAEKMLLLPGQDNIQVNKKSFVRIVQWGGVLPVKIESRGH